MKNLFTDFDAEACGKRVSPIIQKAITDSLYPGISVPDMPRLTRHVVVDVVGYIAELVRTRGQESNHADYLYESMTATLAALNAAGMIRDEWFWGLFFPAMRNIVEDELRRCGVGKTNSTFVEEEESP